jgi:hypothetical protein
LCTDAVLKFCITILKIKSQQSTGFISASMIESILFTGAMFFGSYYNSLPDGESHANRLTFARGTVDIQLHLFSEIDGESPFTRDIATISLKMYERTCIAVMGKFGIDGATLIGVHCAKMCTHGQVSMLKNFIRNRADGRRCAPIPTYGRFGSIAEKMQVAYANAYIAGVTIDPAKNTSFSGVAPIGPRSSTGSIPDNVYSQIIAINPAAVDAANRAFNACTLETSRPAD